MERREYLRLANDRGDPVPIHIRFEIPAHAPKNHSHVLAPQILEQIVQGARGRVIDIGDRRGFDDEPAHRRLCLVHQRTHLVAEAVLIRVEQIRPEFVDDEPGLGDFAGGVAGPGSQRPFGSGRNIMVCGR